MTLSLSYPLDRHAPYAFLKCIKTLGGKGEMEMWIGGIIVKRKF